MVAFDLLYLNGFDLRKLPLIERKALLKNLIADTGV
jgi:bifunctional non-homologous end joining protein LigD